MVNLRATIKNITLREIVFVFRA